MIKLTLLRPASAAAFLVVAGALVACAGGAGSGGAPGGGGPVAGSSADQPCVLSRDRL